MFVACAIVLHWTTLALSAEQSQSPLTAVGDTWPDSEALYEASASNSDCLDKESGSPAIPVDSWIYPAVWRLYSMGFVDHVFLNMRPWTRVATARMLNDVENRIENSDPGPVTDRAKELYNSLMLESGNYVTGPCGDSERGIRVESVYSVIRSLSGKPLRDSYHLGSTIVNDYGRPYEHGFNNYSGLSGYASVGAFTLYLRGEFEGAPSAVAYSQALGQELSSDIDLIPFLNPQTGLPYSQPTIPLGPIRSTAHGRIMEGYLSAHVLGHEVAFGKQDRWLGPAQGGSMAYSNNAENIYSLSIDRVNPFRIPLLSDLTGPFRYDFLVGPLHGHTYVPNPAGPAPDQPNVLDPGAPWVHVEKISFRPTDNLEIGFERSVIWGGKGHAPITLHTFLNSFFSFSGTSAAVKFGRDDPGARFGSFDFTYRVPFVRNWLTLYADSNVHDDLSAIDAPARGAWRPGIYLSHFPGASRLDMRLEAAWTDPSVSSSSAGRFMYYEVVQRQGYTNNGQLFGDWIGREDKGGQAWMTYHLSGNEWIQVGARNQKAAKDFIATPSTQYGTTLNDLSVQAVKRIGKDFEVNASFAFEHYKAPIYLSAQQTVTTTNIQLTWYPQRKWTF